MKQKKKAKEAYDPKSLAEKTTDKVKKLKMANQPLTHSVFILGWGVDEEENPYWIIRNSYGPLWGQYGDFHIRRGQDDYGIEAEVSAFNVELYTEFLRK